MDIVLGTAHACCSSFLGRRTMGVRAQPSWLLSNQQGQISPLILSVGLASPTYKDPPPSNGITTQDPGNRKRMVSLELMEVRASSAPSSGLCRSQRRCFLPLRQSRATVTASLGELPCALQRCLCGLRTTPRGVFSFEVPTPCERLDGAGGQPVPRSAEC